MSALMADHRDYADDARQPSLFDALAPPPSRANPETDEAEQGRVVEFPRRREAPAEDAQAAPPAVGAEPDAPEAAVPSVGAGPAAPEAVVRTADPAPVVTAPTAHAAPAIDAPAADATPALDAAPATWNAPETVPDETCTPRVAGLPLAGPTLDDVMSRVWEGLATGLPAACPVCHGEVLPSLGGPVSGRCTSCGTTID